MAVQREEARTPKVGTGTDDGEMVFQSAIGVFCILSGVSVLSADDRELVGEASSLDTFQRLATLLHQMNSIGDEISRIIRRPALTGHESTTPRSLVQDE